MNDELKSNPSSSERMNRLLNEFINCQKMIDFGSKDWHKYGAKMLEIRKAILAELTKSKEEVVSQLIDLEPTTDLKGLLKDWQSVLRGKGEAK